MLPLAGSIYFRKAEAAREYWGIAQLVEHLPCKQGVIGSNPITSTTHGLIAQLVRAHA